MIQNSRYSLIDTDIINKFTSRSTVKFQKTLM